MRLGDFTQFFQPLFREMRNRLDYFWYTINCLPWKRKFWKAVLFVGYLVAILAFICSIGTLLDTLVEDQEGISRFFGPFQWLNERVPFQILSLMVGAIFPVLFGMLSHIAHIDRKYVSESKIEDNIYDEIEPPILENGITYKRIDIEIGTKKETVFISDQIDEWLQSDAEITMERDYDYERQLRKQISKNFEDLYQPFLQHNYRKSLFQGRQFTNEPKWGISDEMLPEKTENGYKSYRVKVHRTCYFDTYLTNIIPGKKLVSNRTKETAYSAGENCLPYITMGENTETKRLLKLGSKFTANELGVTTLCFLKGEAVIPLWTQNQQAQSSRGQIVASGSGSADWDDCQQALTKNHGDFRKAVTYGMERELFEESIGERNVRKKEFLNHVETEIIGYFRWLQKGAKSEFVGMTRLDMERLMGKLTPEQSEVVQGTYVSAKNINILKEKLKGLVHPKSGGDGSTYVSEGCSISCAVAILALQKRCEKYCDRCPNSGNCENCADNPSDVLFKK